jgi:hypothetical protein
MLPTFPRIVGYRRQENMRLIEALVGKLSPVHDQVAHHRQFEGREGTIHRADDTEGAVEFKEMSATVDTPVGPLEEFTAASLIDALRTVASQLAEAFSKHLVEVMEATTDETGNVVDAKGQPFTPDLMLQVFDKMELSFDESGEWKPPTMMVGPGVVEKIKASETPESIEAFNKKLKVLIENKYEQYRRREANRILAG